MHVLKKTLEEHSGYLLLAAGLLVLLLFVTPASAAWSGSGAGTSGDPYQITTTSQWNEMNNYKGSTYANTYFKLMNDLDWAGGTPDQIGGDVGDADCPGYILGNGKALKNLAIPQTAETGCNRVGGLFFGAPHIYDLTLINADATFSSGSCSQYNSWFSFGGGTFSNLFVDSTSSMTVSGLKAGDKVGGIVCSDVPYVDQCAVLGDITVENDVAAYVGGIMAQGSNSYMSRFTNSYYGGTITYSSGHSNLVHGAFAGYGSSVGSNCYFDGTKTGDDSSGATSKTTSQMTTQGTFTGWTFDSTHWRMSYASPGKFLGYPVWYTAVDIPPVPVASFTMSTQVNTPYAPAVVMTDTSTNTPTSWAWSWGDGTSNSTTQNPSHTYSSPASTTTYTITLTATNAGGSSSTTNTTVFYRAPTANYSVSDHTFVANGANDAITFTDSSTNSPWFWYWDFGDGATATTQNPVHHYTTAGIYDPLLVVANPAGNSTVTKVGYISAGDAISAVTLNAANPNPASVGATVWSGWSSSGNPLSYRYDYDDGSATTTDAFHVYSSAGTYDCSLGVQDYDGAWTYDNETDWVTVSGTVTAGFTMNQSSGEYPLTVEFTDTSTGGTFDSAVWNFGDGGSSTDQNPTHTFNSAGTYSVSLLWTNTATDSGYVTHNVIVSNPGAPSASFSRDKTGGAAPLTVNFTDTSTGGTAPFTYYWNFGDGTTATTQNASHTFTTVNTFILTHTITDTFGLSDSEYSSITTSAPVTGNATVTTNVTATDWGKAVTVTVDTRGVTQFTRGSTIYDIDEWGVYQLIPTPYSSNYTWSDMTVLQNNHLNVVDLYTGVQTNPPVSNGYGYIPSATDFTIPWSAYAGYYVGMKNASYDSGAWQYGGLTQVLLTWKTPVATWTSYPDSGGTTVHVSVALNSFSGLDTPFSQYSQQINSYVRNTSTGGWDFIEQSNLPLAGNDGMYTWLSSAGGEIGSNFIACNLTDCLPTLIGTQPVSGIVVPASAKTGTIGWYNAAGTTKASAYNADPMYFRFNTGNNGGYVTGGAGALEIVLYKYNEISAVWEPQGTVAWTEIPDTGDVGGVHYYNPAWTTSSFIKGSGTTGALAIGKYRLSLISGYSPNINAAATEVIMTTSTLTVASNPYNPSNIGNATGGFMGLDPGLGGILLGTVIAGVLAILGFFLIRDARVFIIAGIAGVIIAFALGLYPLWLIVVIGIAGIAAMLFASGLLGGGGNGGSPPAEG